MLLNIYLGISLATFILFTLEIGKLEHEIKMKFKDRFKPKIDKIGLIFTYIKLMILCFIPIFNILWLIMLGYYFLVDDSKLVNMNEINKSIENKIKE